MPTGPRRMKYDTIEKQKKDHSQWNYAACSFGKIDFTHWISLHQNEILRFLS